MRKRLSEMKLQKKKRKENEKTMLLIFIPFFTTQNTWDQTGSFQTHNSSILALQILGLWVVTPFGDQKQTLLKAI